MDSETLSEFLSLVKDAQEQLAYFQELGVENIDAESATANSADKAAAGAERVPIESSPLEDGGRAVGAAAAVIGAKAPTTARQATTTTLPQDTLFGDLEPAPETIR